MTARVLPLAGFAALLAAGCVVYDSGPVEPGGFPRVEGRWSVDAFALQSTCSRVSDERFTVRAYQNRDILQLVVDVAGSGQIRYDGRIDRDGRFFVRQNTVLPHDGIRDDSDVEGHFDYRSLTATEIERVTDLVTGRWCEIVWRWRGTRR